MSVCRGKLRSVNQNKNNINKEVYCGSKNSTTKVATVHPVLIVSSRLQFIIDALIINLSFGHLALTIEATGPTKLFLS